MPRVHNPDAGLISPLQISERLDIPYRNILSLLQGGLLGAEKSKGRWLVRRPRFEAFEKRNRSKIKRLRKEYVSLYWQGLSPKQLQNRVPDDFARAGIVAREAGFAERTIYDHLMGRSSE